jgi:hypothetical protein
MKGNPPGRPTHQPNDKGRKQVETMSSYGIPELEIARVLEISAPTLRKYYAYELGTGHIKANALVAQSLFQKATGNGPGAVVACIFWLKVRAGWREYPVDEAALGKKEQAQIAATTAAEGTEWGTLVH